MPDEKKRRFAKLLVYSEKETVYWSSCVGVKNAEWKGKRRMAQSFFPTSSSSSTTTCIQLMLCMCWCWTCFGLFLFYLFLWFRLESLGTKEREVIPAPSSFLVSAWSWGEEETTQQPVAWSSSTRNFCSLIIFFSTGFPSLIFFSSVGNKWVNLVEEGILRDSCFHLSFRFLSSTEGFLPCFLLLPSYCSSHLHVIQSEDKATWFTASFSILFLCHEISRCQQQNILISCLSPLLPVISRDLITFSVLSSSFERKAVASKQCTALLVSQEVILDSLFEGLEKLMTTITSQIPLLLLMESSERELLTPDTKMTWLIIELLLQESFQQHPSLSPSQTWQLLLKSRESCWELTMSALDSRLFTPRRLLEKLQLFHWENEKNLLMLR